MVREDSLCDFNPLKFVQTCFRAHIVSVLYAFENNCGVECFILVEFVNYVIIIFQGLIMWQAGALFLEIMFY